MNNYLKNLNRIEFVVTNDCTGKCIHCSQGDHPYTGISLDKNIGAKAIREISVVYKIESAMVFGGEPLMYPESTFAILHEAYKCGIEKRQLITNGFFSKDTGKIKKVALMLKESGVNDILLSVDAFHQKTIPDTIVKLFLKELLNNNLNVRLNPAWLVSPCDDNPYNIITRKIIDEFKKEGAKESDGNVIFPEGNAIKHLGEYFDAVKVSNPYIEDPFDVKSISIEPDGTLFKKSLYKQNIIEILNEYRPVK